MKKKNTVDKFFEKQKNKLSATLSNTIDRYGTKFEAEYYNRSASDYSYLVLKKDTNNPGCIIKLIVPDLGQMITVTLCDYYGCPEYVHKVPKSKLFARFRNKFFAKEVLSYFQRNSDMKHYFSCI